MSDQFHGMSRDEVACDALLSTQDWADWRAARGYEPTRRPTRDEMIAHFAADRVELEGVAERAIVHDGWRTYPQELRARQIVVHATLSLTGCGDPTAAELRAQLEAIGFDTIDIEGAA